MMMTTDTAGQPFNGLRIPLVPERWLDALLVQVDGQFVKRRDITEKLARIGVHVAKEVEPHQATAEMMMRYPLVVVAMTQLAPQHGRDMQAIANDAKAHLFFVQHQTSTENWERLAAHVRANGQKAEIHPPVSEVRMADREEHAPQSSAVHLPAPASKDDAALAAMYAQELEDLKVEKAKLEHAHKSLATEVSRLTNLLNSSSAATSTQRTRQLEEQLESARKKLEEMRARAEAAEEEKHDLEIVAMDAKQNIRRAEKTLAEREEALSRNDSLDALTDLLRRNNDRAASTERAVKEITGTLEGVSSELARLRGMLGSISLQPAMPAPLAAVPLPTVTTPLAEEPKGAEPTASEPTPAPITPLSTTTYRLTDRVLHFYSEWEKRNAGIYPSAGSLAQALGLPNKKSAANAVSQLRLTGYLAGPIGENRVTEKGAARAASLDRVPEVTIAPPEPKPDPDALTATEMRMLVALNKFRRKYHCAPPPEALATLAKLKDPMSAQNALRRARVKGYVGGGRSDANLSEKGEQAVAKYLADREAARAEAEGGTDITDPDAMAEPMPEKAAPKAAPKPAIAAAPREERLAPTVIVRRPLAPAPVKYEAQDRRKGSLMPGSTSSRIVDYLRKHGPLTNLELARVFRMEPPNVHACTYRLSCEGHVVKANDAKPFKWRVAKR